MNIKDYISDIDSKRFGFKIAKTSDFSEGIGLVVSELRKSGVRLIISRVKSADIELINEMEDFNFRIKDTQITLRRNLEGVEQLIEENNYNKTKFILRQAVTDDKKAVGYIALDAFKNYGHYAANKQLDINKANKIYKDWAERSCNDKTVADYMFVAEMENRIAGFLSLKVNKENKTIIGIQHLGAVDKLYRNDGVFRLLIIKCLIQGAHDRHNEHRTYLLAVNYPVIRSYQKLGFKISDTHHTMHCWL